MTTKDDILRTGQRITKARAEAEAAVARCRQAFDDPGRTVDELKKVCAEALKAMADLSDMQTDYCNELITAGQIMADYIAGKPAGPKS